MTKNDMIAKIKRFSPASKLSLAQSAIVDGDWDMASLENLSKDTLDRLLVDLAVEAKDFGIIEYNDKKATIKDKIWIQTKEDVAVELFLTDTDEIILSITNKGCKPDFTPMNKKEFAILHGLMFAFVERHDLNSLAAVLAMQKLEIQTAY